MCLFTKLLSKAWARLNASFVILSNNYTCECISCRLERTKFLLGLTSLRTHLKKIFNILWYVNSIDSVMGKTIWNPKSQKYFKKKKVVKQIWLRSFKSNFSNIWKKKMTVKILRTEKFEQNKKKMQSKLLSCTMENVTICLAKLKKKLYWFIVH